MRALRSILMVTLVAVGMMVVAPAAYAAGTAPHGQGLSHMLDDYHISNLSCDDASITDVLVSRGGITGWVHGGTDRMYLLSSISGDFTVNPGPGEFTYSWSKSYGVKAGKTTNVVCDVDFGPHTHGGITEVGTMQFTLARIW